MTLTENSSALARLPIADEPLKKFLQTQGVVKPSMYVAFIANVWCAFSNWLFMYALGWGFLGAPLARASCQWVMVFCILTYMAWTGMYFAPSPLRAWTALLLLYLLWHICFSPPYKCGSALECEPNVLLLAVCIIRPLNRACG